MQLKKIFLVSLISAAVGGVLTSCYKTQSADKAELTSSDVGEMSVLERARLARLQRKAQLERRRREKSEFYTLREEGRYAANVFFEDEIVDSRGLSLQVPKDFIAVLSKPIESGSMTAEKLTLINDRDKVSAEIDNTPDFAGINFGSQSFCQSIQSKLTAYSNISVDRSYELYRNGNSYICRLHLKDVTTNQTISEVIETAAPDKVTLVKTASFNNTYMAEEILKTAFSRVYSPALKDAVRLASCDFYDTEKYEKLK